MSCGLKSTLAGAQRTRVSVNGTVIPHDLISREAQNHPAPTPAAAWREAARALVVRELLLQEARRQGIDPDPQSDAEGRRETDEEALVRALVEREVMTPAADEATCRRYYNQNKRRFCSRVLYEASHILLAARSEDKPARAAALELAKELIATLRQNAAMFPELARQYSACPSAASGGSLGQIGPGDTVPEFERALSELIPGAMSKEPVETRYGFHIIHLRRRIDGRELPFELVHDRIAAYLTERTRRLAVAQFVARLAAAANVEGVELPTPTDLRVSGGQLQ
jgi:peptidyl-prolyl cis-trans isomerase C